MVRPRRDSGVIPAKERLDDAFWDMFSEMPYRDITIAAISKRAEVNHNTLYYYYDNLEDMAVTLIEENFIPDLPALVMDSLVGGVLDMDSLVHDLLIRKRFGRMCLLVGNNSEMWIMDSLKDATKNLWLKAFAQNPASLDKSQEALFDFIIGGILSVLGKHGQSGDPAQIKEMIGEDFAMTLLPVIKSLRESLT